MGDAQPLGSRDHDREIAAAGDEPGEERGRKVDGEPAVCPGGRGDRLPVEQDLERARVCGRQALDAKNDLAPDRDRAHERIERQDPRRAAHAGSEGEPDRQGEIRRDPQRDELFGAAGERYRVEQGDLGRACASAADLRGSARTIVAVRVEQVAACAELETELLTGERRARIDPHRGVAGPRVENAAVADVGFVGVRGGVAAEREEQGERERWGGAAHGRQRSATLVPASRPRDFVGLSLIPVRWPDRASGSRTETARARGNAVNVS
jgi:hypothetical protein